MADTWRITLADDAWALTTHAVQIEEQPTLRGTRYRAQLGLTRSTWKRTQALAVDNLARSGTLPGLVREVVPPGELTREEAVAAERKRCVDLLAEDSEKLKKREHESLQSATVAATSRMRDHHVEAAEEARKLSHAFWMMAEVLADPNRKAASP